MEVAIRVRGVTKIYAEGAARVTALEGVDLDLHKGELLFLMGPSGSGKTTLLSIMGCILRSTSGSLQIAGQEVTGLSERELPQVRLSHIGFVFQSFNLFPTLTAVENVEVALELKGIRGKLARTQALSLLEQVHLDNKASAFPADLSGGQKQRVALARALAGSPEILLADEPTAALDSHTGRSVLELMRQLAHDHNRAVAVVTHDSRIADLGDRVVHIEDGAVSSVKNLRRPDLAKSPSHLPTHSDPQFTLARPL